MGVVQSPKTPESRKKIRNKKEKKHTHTHTLRMAPENTKKIPKKYRNGPKIAIFAFSVIFVKVSTVMASRGSSQRGQCQRAHSTLRTKISISPSPHHLSKLDFRHHLIPPVLISLPLKDFGHSSPVIVMVKICVSSFDNFSYFGGTLEAQ